MSSVIKGIFISFSIYSKIPVPQFPWEEKDMKYTLCFFPWIGIVIGLLVYGWSYLCFHFQIGSLCYTLIGSAIPLAVSGGFHMDGFMDTMDAFHSYQPREKKLEILKDSHIGAFSVIMLALYYLIFTGSMSEVKDLRHVAILSFGFFFARALSGIGVVSFRAAKEEGLLYTFASGAHRRTVKTALIVQLILAVVLMLWIDWLTALIAIGLGTLTFIYYRIKSYRELGGITGDTAGYFVTICELAFVAGAALGQIIQII